MYSCGHSGMVFAYRQPEQVTNSSGVKSFFHVRSNQVLKFVLDSWPGRIVVAGPTTISAKGGMYSSTGSIVGRIGSRHGFLTASMISLSDRWLLSRLPSCPAK